MLLLWFHFDSFLARQKGNTTNNSILEKFRLGRGLEKKSEIKQTQESLKCRLQPMQLLVVGIPSPLILCCL